MVTLANGFADKGHDVDLVLASARGPYLTDVSDAVGITDLASDGVLKSLPGLVRYLRRKRPDALLSAMTHANVVALLARRLAGVPTRLVVSERNSPTAYKDNYPGLTHRAARFLMRRLYPGADAITVVAQAMRQELMEQVHLDPARVHVIYNPIDLAGIVEQMRQPADHPWFDDAETDVILGVGRLTRQKDFPTLVRAFARLRERRRLRLVILGEGEEREALVSLVSDLGVAADVAFPGFVANPFAYMRRSALFVLSSRWEGLPGALIQAMACATPVVSTDCATGPAEILENGRWGRLVPVGNVDALADAMAATFSDPVHADVARRAADFSVDKAVTHYLKTMGC